MWTGGARSRLACQICEKPAEFFCIGHQPIILLCAKCNSDHEKEQRHEFNIIPIDQFEQFEQNSSELPQERFGPRKRFKGEQRNPAEYVNRSSLPLVKIDKGRLGMWSLSTLQWRETTLDYPLMYAESYVWMDTALFCSNCYYYAGKGKWEYSQLFTFQIKPNGKVTRLPDMLFPRKERVLWWYHTGRQVLAFGGLHRSCECNTGSSHDRSAPENGGCEALSRDSSSWRALPHMKFAHRVLCACEFLQYIYICGGDLIEIYDPKNSLFLEPLSISPPDSHIVIVENNQLVVISTNHLTRFEATEGGNLVLFSQVKNHHFIRIHKQPPVVDAVNGFVYFIDPKDCRSTVSSIELSKDELVNVQSSTSSRVRVRARLHIRLFP